MMGMPRRGRRDFAMLVPSIILAEGVEGEATVAIARRWEVRLIDERTGGIRNRTISRGLFTQFVNWQSDSTGSKSVSYSPWASEPV